MGLPIIYDDDDERRPLARKALDRQRRTEPPGPRKEFLPSFANCRPVRARRWGSLHASLPSFSLHPNPLQSRHNQTQERTSRTPCIFSIPTPAPSMVHSCDRSVNAFQGLELNDRVPPDHDLPQVRPLRLLRSFLQDDVQECVVTAQDPNQFAISVQKQFEPLVLRSRCTDVTGAREGRRERRRKKKMMMMRGEIR